MTQNNLGTALATLGGREAGTARLEEAVAAYQEALKERTRERVPLDWATTQNNLGNALSSLGEREAGTARLEEAVQAYRLALEEQTRARVPLQWATTQMNLGTALLSLGDVRQAQSDLAGAVQAYEQSQEIAAKLAASDPGNAQWQIALVVSLGKLALIGDEPRMQHERGLAILRALDAQGRLTAQQQGWIGDFEQALAQLEFDALNVQIADAFAARDYERAAGVQRGLVERLEGKADQPTLVNALGQLSYYALFARNFAQAKDAAERALALDKGQRWIETNLAHALMFTGATEAARVRYLGNRGLDLGEGRRWEGEVLADFQQLKGAGLSHPLMAEIEARFAEGTTPAPAFEGTTTHAR